jgi:hypothetical protein
MKNRLPTPTKQPRQCHGFVVCSTPSKPELESIAACMDKKRYKNMYTTETKRLLQLPNHVELPKLLPDGPDDKWPKTVKMKP